MKIVINKCYGGFGLSPLAVQRLAELKGKPCFFFKREGVGGLTPTSLDKIKGLFWAAYTVPNPDEVAINQRDWRNMSDQERRSSNESWTAITLDSRPDDRADPDLVKVVEELGELASGDCAQLKVVEIPDGIQWEIDEYDGLERVEERHASWG